MTGGFACQWRHRGSRRKRIEPALHSRPSCRSSNRRKIMARKRPSARAEFVLFDVFYEDGSRSSNRKVPASELRSEEHTSELQSLMRISYAVFCLKKKKKYRTYRQHSNH